MGDILKLLILLQVMIGVSYGELNPYIEALKAHPWKSEQRYIEVRPGAHMFYWLYYADGTNLGAHHRPLLIWIQGGPGLAASGVANFAEIGPLDMQFRPRNHTWVRGRNVLLIDHPVGTGYSYVTNTSLLVKTDKQAATDLARLIRKFFQHHKQFRQTPTYIFGQSYGGKLLPRLSYYLHVAINNFKLKMNFKGIGIGSGWVDPKESTLVQPDFLYNMGVIDQSTYLVSTKLARDMGHYIDKKRYKEAGQIDDIIFKKLNHEAGMDLNFNNINQISPYPALEALSRMVNSYVTPTLSVVDKRRRWHYISDAVFDGLKSHFLVPSSKFLEMLLNRTDLKIAVYNGNLDVVTPLAGASNWAHKLKWAGAEEFRNAHRVKIRGDRNGFYKATDKFSFWWVFASGHWVPEDNPTAMEQILEHVIEG